MNEPARVAVLVGSRGRGTNMAALVTACQSGHVPAEVVLVVSPKAATPAVLRAEALRTTVVVADPKGEGYEAELLRLLREAEVEWVCLAGYMTLLPLGVVRAFAGRLLNIHPALLPKFGGKGMYGRHVHEAVIAAGETESGCSIHQVTERYDEGPVVYQVRCPVLPDDTPETLADRVLDLEREAYPEALRRVIEEAKSLA